MLRLAFIVLAFALVPDRHAHAQTLGDMPRTLSERLSATKNVGLKIEEKLGGYVLVVYDNQQDSRNREILKMHEKEWGNTYARILKYQKLIEEAEKSGKSESIAALSIERDRIEPDPFNGVKLCRVVYVSSDYIELEELYRPDGTVVIPLNKLARVQFVRNQETK